MRIPRPDLARAATHLAAVLTIIPVLVLAGVAVAATPGEASAQLQPAQAGERIQGSVVGEMGQPLAGVQVTIAGTRLGAVTGDNGRYTITGVAPGTHAVRAQRIGYRPTELTITVTAGVVANADFRLESAPTTLTEQVVVGYTTQQRRDVSDAVASVDAEDIQDQAVATVEEALRGRVPGVNITASGEPGRPAQVIIRGQNFLGNPTPLYVVDGMYLRQNPNLNPDDIESIEVLKDASAAAQYGSQAANGVIVIRTRQGRQADANRVELRSYFGSQVIGNQIDMMNARQWAELEKMAHENAGQEVPGGVSAVLAAGAQRCGPNVTASTCYEDTDWQDAVFNTGTIQDHNLSMSGGTQNASYLISGGLLDQQGSVIETKFRRYSLRVNSEVKRGRFTIGENIALSRGLRQGLVADPLTGFPLGEVVRMLPTVPVRRDTTAACALDRSTCFRNGAPTVYGYGGTGTETYGSNPVGLLEKRPQNERSNQVIGSAFGQIDLPFHLRYRLNLGVNYENYGRSEFRSITQIRMGPPNEFAELNEIRNDFNSLLAENLLSYDNSFREGAHRLNAVAGYTEQVETADDIRAFRRGFADEDLRVLAAGDEADATNFGERRRTVLQSYLARANYTLFDRYLLTGSLRRDGSSRFGPKNRWGVFSAFSLGWILSEENFFRGLPYADRVSFLKLRASSGTLGNQDIRDYAYSVPLETNRLGYNFGGGPISGASIVQLANEDIRWQENKQENIGLDLGLLEDRVTFTFDAYRSTANDLLVEVPIPLSAGVGFNPDAFAVVNAGAMRNTGTEFGLTYRFGGDDERGFRLSTTATLTTVRNRVLRLGRPGDQIPDQSGAALTRVGHPIGTFFLIRTAGIFQSEADVLAHTTNVEGTDVVLQPNAEPGDLRYVDANGDGQITEDDRVPVGNGTPKFQGGLFFDGAWRGFDFGLNLRGAGGYKIFNTVRFSMERVDDPTNHPADFRPWTPENRSNTTPRALSSESDNNLFLTDRWLEDGGFLRIQNIVIGYTIPGALLSRARLGTTERARVYLNLQNVHTFTDYKGWDPEVLGHGNPLGRGVDLGAIYPNVRTVSFGVDLRL